MYINSKFNVGKKYEEVQAEKQFADKLYGLYKLSSHGKNPKKSNRKAVNNKGKDQDRKAQEQESQNDSDGHSDSASGGSNNSPKPHGKRNQNRKNSATKPRGTSILTNKSDAVVVAAATNNTKTLNHFEEIRPKDDLEMRKQKSESAENVKPNNKKGGKKRKNKKKEPSRGLKSRIHRQSPRVSSLRGRLNISAMIGMLGKYDLTCGETHILVDYLLNKQQDTIVNHADWSGDIVQKLRRQLEDKDLKLAEEQKVIIGFQNKFRELRAEIVGERTSSQTKIALLTDELHAKKLEIQTIRQELTFQTEKFTNEHKAMSNSIQQLQTALFKEKQNQTHDQNQQQQLIDENFSKTQIINDLQENLHKFQGESTNTHYSNGKSFASAGFNQRQKQSAEYEPEFPVESMIFTNSKLNAAGPQSANERYSDYGQMDSSERPITDRQLGSSSMNIQQQISSQPQQPQHLPQQQQQQQQRNANVMATNWMLPIPQHLHEQQVQLQGAALMLPQQYLQQAAAPPPYGPLPPQTSYTQPQAVSQQQQLLYYVPSIPPAQQPFSTYPSVLDYNFVPSGITYYPPQTQPRPILSQRRPKAIPIFAPSERFAGKVRNSQNSDQFEEDDKSALNPPIGSPEDIDHILDNMFTQRSTQRSSSPESNAKVGDGQNEAVQSVTATSTFDGGKKQL